MTLDGDRTDSSVRLWMDSLQAGDSQAEAMLWSHYFERMVRVARRKLAGTPGAARDDEDIALSAFKSFCLAVRAGRFRNVTDFDSLWGLLLMLTARKVIDELRSRQRAKRGGGERAVRDSAQSSPPLDSLASAIPDPQVAVIAEETFSTLFAKLDQAGDAELTVIAVELLEGKTNEEIAARLGCSTRTVQRKHKTIRALWQQVSQ